MQYNGQTNNEFRYRWNNYKDNNRKSLRGEDHKQAFLLTSKQLAIVALSMTLKSDLLIRQIPLTLLDVRIFGQILLKLAIPRDIIILTPTISYLLFLQIFCSIYLFLHQLFIVFLSTGYFYLLCLLWLGRLLCYPPQKIFSSASSPVTCLFVLLLLFISSYY